MMFKLSTRKINQLTSLVGDKLIKTPYGQMAPLNEDPKEDPAIAMVLDYGKALPIPARDKRIILSGGVDMAGLKRGDLKANQTLEGEFDEAVHRFFNEASYSDGNLTIETIYNPDNGQSYLAWNFDREKFWFDYESGQRVL
jgi:hypothetical protein